MLKCDQLEANWKSDSTINVGGGLIISNVKMVHIGPLTLFIASLTQFIVKYWFIAQIATDLTVNRSRRSVKQLLVD